VTTTFKQKKLDLVKDGFNPAATSDPIYFNDPRSRAFTRMDKTLYSWIEQGAVRF